MRAHSPDPHSLHAHTLLQVRKEFGKTKIFWPSQEGLAALTPEEATAKQGRLKEVQEEAKAAGEAVAALRRGACRDRRPEVWDRAQVVAAVVRGQAAGQAAGADSMRCHAGATGPQR